MKLNFVCLGSFLCQRWERELGGGGGERERDRERLILHNGISVSFLSS